MKRILFAIFILTIFLSTGRIYSQKTDYPIHLFLGGFTFGTDKDTTTENWDFVNDNELKGNTIFQYSGGSFLSETMRLVYINGKLNYCATILEQNPDNPQGEICFGLKSYANYVFTFENLNHDFPKRIIYDFNYWHTIKARIEDDTLGYNFELERENNSFQSYTLNGIFLKEPFENKAGKIIEGAFDYFFQIQGIKYFIILKDNAITKGEVDKVIGKEVIATIIFKEGLWDTNDNAHQSRIGKYVRIIKIN